MKVKCNKCGFIGNKSRFGKGRDFFQNEYIASCPKCNNMQNPGDASMRMFGGERPFEFVGKKVEINDPLLEVLRRTEEAS